MGWLAARVLAELMTPATEREAPALALVGERVVVLAALTAASTVNVESPKYLGMSDSFIGSTESSS